MQWRLHGGWRYRARSNLINRGKYGRHRQYFCMATLEERQERFIRLYTANGSAIRGFVRSLVPTREDASDVMQDVAIVLWRKFTTVDVNDFRRWAFGVARNPVADWLRQDFADTGLQVRTGPWREVGIVEGMAPHADGGLYVTYHVWKREVPSAGVVNLGPPRTSGPPRKPRNVWHRGATVVMETCALFA